MRKITYLLTIVIISSCQKEDAVGIPTYIKIDDIALIEDDANSNITDAWVYVNDQLQGVYELPATFPVIAEEIQNLRVKAGIKVNGIASSRLAYPFYNSYYEDITFSQNETKTISPFVSYLDSINFFLEDFEGTGVNIEISAISDTILLTSSDGDNNFGIGVLSDSLFTFEIATDELIDLPQSGAPVFL